MEPMKPMQPMKPMEPMKPMKPMEPMKPMAETKPWWPDDLGQPSGSGSQNDRRYAYFADSNRLAIDDGGRISVYDTGGRTINGFGQQQGGGDSLTLQSNQGPVDLAQLKTVSGR